jgi:hypothetical protein
MDVCAQGIATPRGTRLIFLLGAAANVRAFYQQLKASGFDVSLLYTIF